MRKFFSFIFSLFVRRRQKHRYVLPKRNKPGGWELPVSSRERRIYSPLER